MLFSAVAIIAGLTGIGYGISKAKKREPENVSYTQDLQGSQIVDTLEASAAEASGQADAVVVDAVNAFRIERLIQELSRIDRNKSGADEEIQILKAEVKKLLFTNRGGCDGIHGFIGETSQVHISNIKAFIKGDEPLYILLDDNSMTDYVRGMQLIQQKACQAGGHLGLDAIKLHRDKYPEFVERGGIYQIPKDVFERYTNLKGLPKDAALKLRKEDLTLWRFIQRFSKSNPDIVIEPMEVSYRDIQAGNIEDTINTVEEDTVREFERQRNDANLKFAPNIKEFFKVCGISAAIEGGIDAGFEFIHKLKGGKKLTEFTRQDVKDILSRFSIGCGKGALRGGLVYIATNTIKMPAAIASGIITAIYGTVREGYLYINNKITKKDFLKNSLLTGCETIASVGCAYIGKTLFKKHPVIGSLAGSILGSYGANYIRRTVFA